MLKKLNRKNASAEETRVVKILQFGEGNFLRAFVDWMVDILNEKTDFDGAVEIVQPIIKGMAKEVNAARWFVPCRSEGNSTRKDLF